MNRDAILELDTAIDKIEQVHEQILFLPCADTMSTRLDSLLEQLTSLRVALITLQADFLTETTD